MAQERFKIDRLLRVKTVAEYLEMSAQDLYSAIRCGHFPCVRIGSRVRIPESAIRNFIEDQMKEKEEVRDEAA